MGCKLQKSCQSSFNNRFILPEIWLPHWLSLYNEFPKTILVLTWLWDCLHQTDDMYGTYRTKQMVWHMLWSKLFCNTYFYLEFFAHSIGHESINLLPRGTAVQLGSLAATCSLFNVSTIRATIWSLSSKAKKRWCRSRSSYIQQDHHPRS